MLGESAAPGARCPDAGLRLPADEKLFACDITGLFESIEMSAEIAVGCAHQFPEPNEFERVVPAQNIERGHDLKPHRLMDDLVACHDVTPGVAAKVRRR